MSPLNRVPCRKPLKKAIARMLDMGVFDKYILQDIAKDTGLDYQELRATSKTISRKAVKPSK